MLLSGTAAAYDTCDPIPDIDWLKLLGLIGAAFAFLVGLQQYSRAQRWKRVEFLANEIKELLADRRASLALSMIDQTSSEFRLKSIDDENDNSLTRVSVKDQWVALLPHTVEKPRGCDIDSDTERRIRDCYDALLDRIDRLGSCLQTDLLTVGDLRPYLAYYIYDIAAATEDPQDALWTVCFITYNYFYHFDSVPVLFQRFKRDIQPSGALFTSFMEKVPLEHQELARELQSIAKAACEETRRALAAPSNGL